MALPIDDVTEPTERTEPARAAQPARAAKPAQPAVAEPAAEPAARAGRTSVRAAARPSATQRRSRPPASRPDPGLEAIAGLHETDPTGVSLTREEVLAASGLSAKELGDLERFGLVVGRSLGNTVYYGDDALLVTQLAAGFMSHGVEARHLRMYKVAAKREAGVFEQLVMPLLKQRNPGARRQATERLDELAGLGSRLRSAMLRQALQDHLGTTP